MFVYIYIYIILIAITMIISIIITIILIIAIMNWPRRLGGAALHARHLNAAASNEEHILPGDF